MIAEISNYDSFKKDFTDRIENEWHLLFNQYAEQLNIKNKNTAINKLQQIFEATFHLSQLKGFQAMTLRDLCQQTGISMGGLYTYFKNKNQIAAMIHGCLIQTCQIWLNDESLKKLEPAANFEQLIKLHLFLSERLKKWFYFAYMECKHLDKTLMHEVIKSEQNMEEKITQSIHKGLKSKQLCCNNPEFTAAMIKSMLQDWYLKTWKYQQKKVSVDQFKQQLLEFLSNNLNIQKYDTFKQA